METVSKYKTSLVIDEKTCYNQIRIGVIVDYIRRTVDV